MTKGAVSINEGDTVVFVLRLLDRQKLPVIGAVDVEFVLYGPGAFVKQSKSLAEGGVDRLADGSYETSFDLGRQGEYECVATAVNAAGQRKSQSTTFYANHLRGQ